MPKKSIGTSKDIEVVTVDPQETVEDKKEEIANKALESAISLSKSFGQDTASIEAKKLQ